MKPETIIRTASIAIAVFWLSVAGLIVWAGYEVSQHGLKSVVMAIWEGDTE